MAGLDPRIIEQLGSNLAIGRIKTDIHTDFILAPHYSAVYENAPDALWEITRQTIHSGKYEPDLPITIDVPKRNGLTRPGSILPPIDRLVYQAIVDFIAPAAEAEIERRNAYLAMCSSKEILIAKCSRPLTYVGRNSRRS